MNKLESKGMIYVAPNGDKYIGVTYQDGDKGKVTKLDPVFGGLPKYLYHSKPADKARLSKFRMLRNKESHMESKSSKLIKLLK